MIDKTTSNNDTCFLVLARPADTLSTLASQVLPAEADVSFFSSIYDAVAALLSLGPHTPVVFITRPAMLAKPHLPSILQQFPNLRTIGWLTPGQNPDSYITDHLEQTMVTVSTADELAQVTAALAAGLSAMPMPDDSPGDLQTPGNDLDPANYRLSDAELEALLGAEQ